MALDIYRGMRDFRKTSEPKGEAAPASGAAPRFVIQEHAASTHHFDVRLEVDGVLKSWAVPMGPSTDPREKAARGADRGPPSRIRGFRRSHPRRRVRRVKDDEADARRNPVSTQRESVKTGRTVEQVAGEEGCR